MKSLYKFISITVLILCIFLLILNGLSNKTEDEVHQSFNNQDDQDNQDNQDTPNFLESNNISLNNGGICMENSLPSHKPNHLSKIDQDEWTLIWFDEFENNCLDSGNWNIEDWAAEKNNELQYYSPNNVEVEDGLLKLVSKNEKFKGRDYTSGAIHTMDKFSFLYGKVEMRAKLPVGQGIFPAFWMMTDKENTWLPEIDIMEMLGHLPNEVWMVSHWLDNAGTLKSDFSTFKGPDFSKDFHTFGIEWSPDSIVWLVDGEERFRSSEFIPNENMYLYLNTAIGGNWPGSPDNSTVFPTTYEIDYVRVYKRNKE